DKHELHAGIPLFEFVWTSSNRSTVVGMSIELFGKLLDLRVCLSLGTSNIGEHETIEQTLRIKHMLWDDRHRVRQSQDVIDIRLAHKKSDCFTVKLDVFEIAQPATRGGRIHKWAHCGLECEQDVFSRKGFTIMPLYTAAYFERVREVIRRDLRRRFGQHCFRQRPITRVVRHEEFV